MAGIHDVGKQVLVRLDPVRGRPGGALHGQVEAIDLLPHFKRDVLPRHARVLASRCNRGENRVGIASIEHQESNDFTSRRDLVVLGEKHVVACRADERSPLLDITGRKIQAEEVIHINEPCDVLGTLHIAAHPVKRICNTAQHGCPSR